jgi:hypothetical protein
VVTVTDTNGCSDTASITLKTRSSLSLSVVAKTDLTCFGDTNGVISVQASAGIPKYTYSWSVAGSDSILSNLSAGTYVAYATDSIGCKDSLSVQVNEPAQIAISFNNVVDPNCNYDSTGSISVASTGGTGIHSYLWSNADTTSITTNLAAGQYSITVTDSAGCTQSSTQALVAKSSMTNSGLSLSNPVCYNDSTGTASITITGGVSPLAYAWSQGGTTQGISNLPSGVYRVTVTDSLNCTYVDSAVVNANFAKTETGLPQDTANCGAPVLLTPATNFKTYVWSTGSGSKSTLIPTTQIVTFEGLDSNNCKTFDTVNVAIHTAPVVNLGSDTINGCEGTPEILDAGSGFVSYLWSSGDTTQQLSVSSTGKVGVVISDTNNCKAADSTYIVLHELPKIDLGSDTVICEQKWTGSLTLDAGSGFTSYNWSNGDQIQTSTINNPGTYSVEVENSHGCLNSDTVVVSLDPCLGIDHSVFDFMEVNLFPNPARTVINIEVKGLQSQTIGFVLVNTSGQIVRELNYQEVSTGQLNSQMTLEGVAQGVYYLRITHQGETLMRNVVVY